MNPVQPVTTGASGPQAPAGTGALKSNNSLDPAVSSTGVSLSSTLNITLVNSQVDAMLGAIGGGVQDNKLLRMMIALLILQALLTNDSEQQQGAVASLLDSLGQADGGRRGGTIGLQSATSVVQIQQQSTVLATDQAVVSLTGTGGESGGTGEGLDLTA